MKPPWLKSAAATWWLRSPLLFAMDSLFLLCDNVDVCVNVCVWLKQKLCTSCQNWLRFTRQFWQAAIFTSKCEENKNKLMGGKTDTCQWCTSDSCQNWRIRKGSFLTSKFVQLVAIVPFPEPDVTYCGGKQMLFWSISRCRFRSRWLAFVLLSGTFAFPQRVFLGFDASSKGSSADVYRFPVCGHTCGRGWLRRLI